MKKRERIKSTLTILNLIDKAFSPRTVRARAHNKMFITAAGDVVEIRFDFTKFVSQPVDQDVLRKPQPS